MEIIVNHGGTDFDALAAMVACAKLHPQAVIVLIGTQAPGPRRFIAEYKNSLSLQRGEQLSPGTISKLYLIGARDSDPTGDLTWLCTQAESLETIDNRPPFSDSSQRLSQPVGAVTTLLVEQLQRKNLALTVIEATLFLLGIYQGTHFYTHSATSPRDLLAAAWLLSQGGKLAEVGKYMDVRLTPVQQDLLASLLGAARLETINGRKVLLMAASLERFTQGLDTVTRRLTELEDCDLAVSILQAERFLHLAAYSPRPDLDLLQILAPMKAQGQADSVIVSLTGNDAPALAAKVIALLEQRLPKVKVAGDIMSSPVKTIPAAAPIAEAESLFLRHGHGGLPVTEGESVTGIVTRRDIEKALRHNLGQAPVRNCMSRGLVTVDALDPIAQTARLLLHHDIGRVPVLDRGKLVGIITRSNLLKHIHGPGDNTQQSIYNFRDFRLGKPLANLTDLVKSRLPERLQALLILLGQTAQLAGYRAYAVGGFVRDLLLGLPNHDLDVAVEGNAYDLALKLEATAGGKLAQHPEMGTASLTLADGWRIDFAMARSEYYQFPAARPEVEQTTIKQDLYRRDFTINTMAFALNTPNFGQFLDFYGGHRDLQAGLIRVLYNLSFVEDPTRMLRALRFAGRYGYVLEDNTRKMLDRALEDDMLAKATPAQLGREWRRIFQEKNAPALLRLAQELGILPKFIPALNWGDELVAQVATAARLVKFQNQLGVSVQGWLLYPLLLIRSVPGELKPETIERLGVIGKEKQLLIEVAAEVEPLRHNLLNADSPLAIYDLLRTRPPLALLAMLAVFPEEAPLNAKILLYLEKLAYLKTHIGGRDLLQLGVKPGPEMGKILKAVHRAKIAGEAPTPEAELALAERLYKEGQ